MKRMLILLGVVGVVLVALAPAALAKGAGEVVVSGPGLKKPLVIKGAHDNSGPGAFWEFISNTAIFEGTKQAAPPQGVLGPRYRVVVYIARTDSPSVRFDPKRADRFTVFAYPYADPGPWFFLPADVKLAQFDLVSGGWSLGSDAARWTLISRGLPKTSPVPLGAPAVAPVPAIQTVPAESRPPAPENPSAARVWTAVGVAATLALLVVAGAVAGRPRGVRGSLTT